MRDGRGAEVAANVSERLCLFSYWRSSAAYRVRIEMFDAAGKSIFGAIDQRIDRQTPAV